MLAIRSCRAPGLVRRGVHAPPAGPGRLQAYKMYINVAPARRLLATVVSETKAEASKGGWWSSASFWGACGAAAGWGMSGSAIYDSQFQGPEVISLTMTPVMVVYSSLFAWWALAIQPKNLALAACHMTNVAAQSWQLYRAINHKLDIGEESEVKELAAKAGLTGTVVAALVGSKARLKSALSGTALGALATSPAGPFTVHFWAPMSKWLISGASFLELDRPTDTISLPQYTALTLTGFFFTRYATLVRPANYMLCSVNIALFGSSSWHLGRKIHADFIASDRTSTLRAEQRPHPVLADGVVLSSAFSEWVGLVDADKDGIVTDKEIEAFLASADTDGDGQLDLQELEQALQQRFKAGRIAGDGKKLAQHAKEMMCLADTDGDGKVSPEELRAVFQRNKKQ